jgi:hypothetical protein
MTELLRTNDIALIAVVKAILGDEEIPVHVADRHSSVLEGTLNFLQMRILVPEEFEERARAAITEAELGHWLKPSR